MLRESKDLLTFPDKYGILSAPENLSCISTNVLPQS